MRPFSCSVAKTLATESPQFSTPHCTADAPRNSLDAETVIILQPPPAPEGCSAIHNEVHSEVVCVVSGRTASVQLQSTGAPGRDSSVVEVIISPPGEETTEVGNMFTVERVWSYTSVTFTDNRVHSCPDAIVLSTHTLWAGNDAGAPRCVLQALKRKTASSVAMSE
ncbi:hypothetical protein CEXT_325751 [Caerostris extrusa]|uniref:Uncharacterized protein n=1 Tax=Caerostris extrusa TaxID=172846 RepID=A0AAV4M846_CAEEX|nr:hypothetical protein CEXT_325751 [Caerostris extrusa]